MMFAVDLSLDGDAMPWVWLGAAAVFALVELFFVPGSFFLLPWSFSALMSSLLGFVGVGVPAQWLVFMIGGLILFFVMYRWARRSRDRTPVVPGMGADRLVGLTGEVTEAIDPRDPSRSGKVAVEGESWGALTDGAATVPVGAAVVITEMRGTRVVVTPVGVAVPPPPAGIPPAPRT